MRKKVIIIAEVGVNHNGKIHIAKKMIKAAAKSGADFVKFQVFSSELLSTSYAKKPNYVLTKPKESQQEMLKKLELSEKNFKLLNKLCKKNKIGFMASAFDIDSLNFLKSLRLNIYKIPSGEINNLPYLRHVAKFRKKIIFSTGMSSIKEIKNILKILTTNGTKKKNISVLQCNTDYPSSFEDTNLKVIKRLKKMFGVNVGFSDHTVGVEASIAAVALGAEIIEKHFTLDKNLKGPDHKSSLSINELNELVKSIRNVEIALGSSVKKLNKSEKKNIKFVRKSIVAKKKIRIGEIFTANNITTKRPGNGMSPMLWDKLLGKRSKKIYLKDQKI